MTRGGDKSANSGPQRSWLYRLIRAVTRLRLKYHYPRAERPNLLIGSFVFVAGTASVGTIAAVTLLFGHALIFPSLAPTAFLVFYTPMAPTACPRTVVCAHSTAVLAGIGCTYLITLIWPGVQLVGTTDLNWARVVAIMVIMGAVSGFMAVGRFAHPPAAASGLLPALGFLDDLGGAGGLIAGAFLLAGVAFLFNRGIAGLPYPLWRWDPEVVKKYGALAGLPSIAKSYSETLKDGVSHPPD